MSLGRPDRLVIRRAQLPVAGARSLVERDILIERGLIRDIAAPGLSVGDDAEVIDASDRIVMPGLANCHTHSHFAWGRGFGDRWTLELHQNSGGGIWFGATPEDLRLGAMLVAADLIRNGCTAAYDMVLQSPVPSPEGMAAVAAGYQAVGLKAVVAAVVADRTFWEATPGLIDTLSPADAHFVRSIAAPQADRTLASLREVLREWPFETDRIRPAVAPTVPLLCSDAFLRDVARLARDHGAPLQTHLAESKVQAIASRRRWGRSLTAELAATGFLGPDVSVAHAVWVDDDDIRLLARHGVAVAHNPGSNMRLGNGVAPVHAMHCEGVRVGIGTDACSCADHQNMMEATRLAAFASRITSPDPADWLSAETALDMATEQGARILGFPNTGRIAVGNAADLVFLDRRDLAYVPMNDPWAQIVFSESGRGVRSVMIDGAMVYHEGRFTGFDLDALLRDAESAAGRLAEAAADRRERLRSLEPVISRFCVGLARQPHPIDRYVGSAGVS
jgi:guanine deaminase